MGLYKSQVQSTEIVRYVYSLIVNIAEIPVRYFSHLARAFHVSPRFLVNEWIHRQRQQMADKLNRARYLLWRHFEDSENYFQYDIKMPWSPAKGTFSQRNKQQFCVICHTTEHAALFHQPCPSVVYSRCNCSKKGLTWYLPCLSFLKLCNYYTKHAHSNMPRYTNVSKSSICSRWWPQTLPVAWWYISIARAISMWLQFSYSLSTIQTFIVQDQYFVRMSFDLRPLQRCVFCLLLIYIT